MVSDIMAGKTFFHFEECDDLQSASFPREMSFACLQNTLTGILLKGMKRILKFV